ncbi:UDP-glucose 4-epimerase GalE [Kitasatospora sp. NPDC088134]|uniref:UDP-glucose 4-epimerase GalE n=1 Tax=Kitasatospora sp. NPDC088134 TaxID=3364071 RepID=UPI003822CA28
MTWLITGGAGYIGGHVVRELVAAGESVAVLDDLSSGAAVHLPPGVPLVAGSTLDRPLLDAALAEHGVTGVLHLAAKKQVGESVEQPLRYYHENVEGLRTVLAAAVDAGVRRVVLSSSAAVYGMPDVDLVDEKTPCAPMNPYGETKLAGEWLLNACATAHGLSAVSLRYFNVAGAASPELSDPGAANLVPLAFGRLTAGLPPLIYGDDYPTPDGTCVRDYIHVSDVASAHVAAVRRLSAAGPGDPVRLTLNIGTGHGASVREMLAEIAEVTGIGIAPEVIARRAGDPARVVAAADLIRQELGWSAEHDLRSMVASAWAGWQHRHP